MHVAFFRRTAGSVGLALVLFFQSSCQLLWAPNTPKGYLLPKPEKIILAKKLNEISGLNYMPREKAMLAISDSKQKIYRVAEDGTVTDYYPADFGPKGDYEDVVKVDSTVYVLISNGTVVAVTNENGNLQASQYPLQLEGKNDFETLYYDSAAHGLIMVCKSCGFEKEKDQRSAYRFNLATRQFDAQPFYTISIEDVRQTLKDGKVDFKPSAAVIHPLDKKLYMLSSAGNLLIIGTPQGKIEQVFRLNPTLYPQAEGITFAPNGDMFVSNEAKLGKPTLLHIPYKPAGK